MCSCQEKKCTQLNSPTINPLCSSSLEKLREDMESFFSFDFDFDFGAALLNQLELLADREQVKCVRQIT